MRNRVVVGPGCRLVIVAGNLTEKGVAFQDVRPNAGLQDYITQHARLFIVLSSCFCMIGYGTYCCLFVYVCWFESFIENSNEIIALEMHMLNIDWS